MRFGVSIDNKKILTDRPLSSDYLEIGAAGLNKFDRAELSSLESAVNDGTVKLSCANRLFPKDIRLTGDVNWDTVRDHCERTFYNLARLKVETVVFGSGKARRFPRDFRAKRRGISFTLLARFLLMRAKSTVRPLLLSRCPLTRSISSI